MRVFLVALVCILAASCAEAPEVHERQWWVMASPLRVVIVDPGLGDDERDALFERCHRRAAELDALLNIWIDESPLKAFNASAGRPVEVDETLARFVDRCIDDFRRTHGVFDASVGSWRELDEGVERPAIGMDRVVVDRGDGAVRIAMPEGFALDPGGNAKGMAVDAIVEELRRAGVTSAFVDFGSSSLYGLGHDPDGNPWTVAVAGFDGTAIGTVQLVDRGLSVSQSWLIDLGDGSRRFHIVDPRSGRTVEEPRMAVVISPSATDAEVLSTALVVANDPTLVANYDGADGFVLGPSTDAQATAWFTPVR